MCGTAVFRSFVALAKSIVTHHGCNPYPVICEYAVTSLCLDFSMVLDVAPGADGFFIAPERK